MKKNDFSVPRRMSKSAFVILFMKALQSYMSLFLILVVFKFFGSLRENSFMENIMMLLFYVAGFLVLALVTSFLNFYFKKYYVKDHNLVFIHGVIHQERTSVPLNKIHSLRTKSGFIYRLFDMKGVSFDTLASKTEEIEFILNDEDWNALLDCVKIQEKSAIEEPDDETTGQKTCSNAAIKRLEVSNQNLIKGALCQNHFKGMVILFSAFAAFYNQITAVNEKATEYFIDYVGTQSGSFIWSIPSVLVAVVILYVVMLLFWLGTVFLHYYNMDIQISEKQLFFESGLISRNSSRFSFDKVCTLYVKRNFIERWIGYCSIIIKQAFNATDKKNGTEIKIYGSSHDGDLLNWWLGKDYTSSSTILSAQSGYGFLGYTIMLDVMIVFSIAIVLCYYGLYVWLFVPLVYMMISLVKGLLAVRQSYIQLKEDYIKVSNGKFAKVCNYIKYNDIEVVRLVATPFTSYTHRLKLIISTNGTSFTIRSLKEQEAKDIYELLLLKCYNH